MDMDTSFVPPAIATVPNPHRAIDTTKPVQVIFFDNDERHIIDIQQNTQAVAIHVDDTVPHHRGRYKRQYATTFLPNNVYAHIDVQLDEQDRNKSRMSIQQWQQLEPIFTQGFTMAHRDLLYQFIQDHHDEPICAVFDWDRTLSVVEGYISDTRVYNRNPSTGIITRADGTKGFTIKETAEYLVSPERMVWLRDMFIHLYKRNVAVYILTNNSAVVKGTLSRFIFLMIVQQIIPYLTDDHILQSSTSQGIYKSSVLNSNMVSIIEQIKQKEEHPYANMNPVGGSAGYGKTSRKKRKCKGKSKKYKNKKTKSRRL